MTKPPVKKQVPKPSSDSERASATRLVDPALSVTEEQLRAPRVPDVGQFASPPPEPNDDGLAPPAPEDDEDEPTIGDMIRLPEDASTELPGFEMSDDPFPDVENVPETSVAGRPARAGDAEDLGNPASSLPGIINVGPYPVAGDPARAGNATVIPPNEIVYESRIQVLEAFRYMGSFKDPKNHEEAPHWIDRNWLSHGDYDPLRKIEPGPALRVPLDSGVVYARIGDYICKQSVTIAPNLPAEVRLEVWPAETFQKLFMPKPAATQVTTVEATASVPVDPRGSPRGDVGSRSSRLPIPSPSPPDAA